ncbi:hypothetical protein [Microbacterium sp. 77mftsu3.1]|uniref:hypothetical protein n=1 Tax=Microbacterium sp. 77mftsu3.1 TaxID=1761802 RepID=UPI0003680801|nr:hypothetical protein [Microbacterium sp. 77mftsu3.1]SDH53965.1 hypothetical protein SAMN04488590_3517 [Microbacterium sp. 77mftsu3.1]
MKAQGHKLETTWNGRRGHDAVTTATCLCRKWSHTGASQVDARQAYQEHLGGAKKPKARAEKKTVKGTKAGLVPARADGTKSYTVAMQGGITKTRTVWAKDQAAARAKVKASLPRLARITDITRTPAT